MGLIEVRCQCGRVIRAKAELQGKRAKCPACGNAVTIVASQPAAVAGDPGGDQIAAPVASDREALAAVVAEDDQVWHYYRNGKQIGPLSFETLQDIASAGGFSPADQVWKEGWPAWVLASKVKGLVFETAPTTAAAAGSSDSDAASGLEAMTRGRQAVVIARPAGYSPPVRKPSASPSSLGEPAVVQSSSSTSPPSQVTTGAPRHPVEPKQIVGAVVVAIVLLCTCLFWRGGCDDSARTTAQAYQSYITRLCEHERKVIAEARAAGDALQRSRDTKSVAGYAERIRREIEAMKLVPVPQIEILPAEKLIRLREYLIEDATLRAMVLEATARNDLAAARQATATLREKTPLEGMQITVVAHLMILKGKGAITSQQENQIIDIVTFER